MTSPSRQRLLVVEDQKEIRKVLAKQLEGAGYSVVTSESGTAALELLASENFDLVISDIVMPGPIQGPELAKRLCEKIPDQRIIFLSGYADQLFQDEYSSVSEFPRLAKPIFRSELLEAVTKALEK
ncbi:response regulator [Erythrobacter sp.]|uniref:response regulator n=1 Tax=Erythrobacter sp. TaxID=1042 RepID=UPI00311DB3DD